MKPEDKELLLKDLSARLPYEPMVWFKENWETNPNFHGNIAALRLYHLEYIIKDMDITLCPYLRPMSSMTEEEKIEWDAEYAYNSKSYEYEEYLSKMIDWLNAHHFDYRGLIGNGLALEAPEGMYNKEDKE